MSTEQPDQNIQPATLDEICIVAIADAFRGDGEVLCNPMGVVPVIAGRLARATTEPDLMLTDTIAYAITGNLPVGGASADSTVEAYMPFRTIFDQVWSGKRHVVMGASQIDRYGNQNFAAIGPYRKPKAQLLGLRGAPGNLINHATTYWIPNQARAFSVAVDVVSGPGYDKAAELGRSARFFEIRRVVTNLGSYDFETPGHTMRLRSIHPGVEIEQIIEATPFKLNIAGSASTSASVSTPAGVPQSRIPDAEELRLIREVFDPGDLRKGEFR